MYSHAQPTPFGKEVGNGGISSLNSQKATITPMAHNAMAPYGGMSPSAVPSAAMGVHNGTEISASKILTRQIKAMNTIFVAIDICHEQQNKLGRPTLRVKGHV